MASCADLNPLSYYRVLFSWPDYPSYRALVMIDLFTIFNTGGIVLWQKSFKPTSDRVTNSLISDIFIENRTNEETIYHKENYTVRYSVVNELGLIFVVSTRVYLLNAKPVS